MKRNLIADIRSGNVRLKLADPGMTHRTCKTAGFVTGRKIARVLRKLIFMVAGGVLRALESRPVNTKFRVEAAR